MKVIDYKKELKDYFAASDKKISEQTLSRQQYLSILGQGDPNSSPEYQAAIEALFSVSYALKFMIKKGPMEIDYKVLPLEGLWWVENMENFDINDKSNWLWKMMIMQPEFINQNMVSDATQQVQKKKGLTNLNQIKLDTLLEGDCVQILHKGPYSEEGPTIETLHQFIKDKGYTFNGHHHEIYLSDPRRGVPEKLKTIIRQPVN